MAKRIYEIIHVPHEVLRKEVPLVDEYSLALQEFVKNLGFTLEKTTNPKGVGLAAPQVAQELRVFATLLEKKPKIFINPRFTKTSKDSILGSKEDEPIYEGCLSIPGLYGPVPRHSWVECEYETILNDTLTTTAETFHGYEARVMQHELDHLDGVLFTDYSLEYDLPVFQEIPGKKKYQEIDRSILESF